MVSDTVITGQPSNRSVANMLIVLATQDWRNGSSSWKEQVVENTLPFYESGKEDLDNRVSIRVPHVSMTSHSHVFPRQKTLILRELLALLSSLILST